MLAVIALTACVPLRFTGYIPDGAGKRETGYCVAGIRDQLRMPARASADLVVRMLHPAPDGTSELDMYMEISAGVTVRLLSAQVVLESPEWSETRSLTIRGIGASGKSLAPGAPVAASPGERHTLVWLSFLDDNERADARPSERSVPDVQRFSATLPDMEINGEIFRPGTVSFERYRRWGMYYCVQ